MDRRLVLLEVLPTLAATVLVTKTWRTSTCLRQLVPYAGVSLIRFTDPAFAISAFELILKALRQVKILNLFADECTLDDVCLQGGYKSINRNKRKGFLAVQN